MMTLICVALFMLERSLCPAVRAHAYTLRQGMLHERVVLLVAFDRTVQAGKAAIHTLPVVHGTGLMPEPDMPLPHQHGLGGRSGLPPPSSVAPTPGGFASAPAPSSTSVTATSTAATSTAMAAPAPYHHDYQRDKRDLIFGQPPLLAIVLLVVGSIVLIAMLAIATGNMQGRPAGWLFEDV